MTIYTVAIVCCIILTVIGLAILVDSMLVDSDDGDALWGLACAIVCGILSTVGIVTYDDAVIKQADEFFETRTQAYNCKDVGKLKCQYKIQQWQADSVYWIEKVSNILKDQQ